MPAPDDWAARARREQSKAHPLAREVIEAIMPQLLIVFLNRLGGELTVPIKEVDGTGEFNLALSVDQDAGTFTFKTQRKK
jgi:hypothetical protein